MNHPRTVRNTDRFATPATGESDTLPSILYQKLFIRSSYSSLGEYAARVFS